MGEAEAPADDAAVAELRLDLGRRGGRRDVEVLGSTPEQEIAHATPDEVGLKARSCETAHNFLRVRVDLVDVDGRAVHPLTGCWLAFDGVVAHDCSLSAMRLEVSMSVMADKARLLISTTHRGNAATERRCRCLGHARASSSALRHATSRDRSPGR